MIKNVKAVTTVLLFGAVIALSACSSKTDTETNIKAENPGEALAGEESLDSRPLGISEGRTSKGMLPVYYNFDSADITRDQVPRLETNADFAKAHSQYTIRIEGNADSRGTSEYNMALGERRAKSAERYLINLGVDKAKMTTVSYGEERILRQGQDESSMAENRRADFVVVD